LYLIISSFVSITKKVMMDFDDLKAAGSGLGTAAVTVMDKSVDMIAAIRRLSHFYRHESCGQCTPCREGKNFVVEMLAGSGG
jgi:NADH dehydrogenase (ubiquinone) flavoprotein 1